MDFRMHKKATMQHIWFPFSIGTIALIIGGFSGKADSGLLQTTGLTLDIFGAIVLSSPDLVLRNYISTPETLEEARDQLFEVGHMIRGEAREERIEALLDVIQKNWEGEFANEPEAIYIRKLYPDQPQEGVRVHYDEDGEMPEYRVFEGDFNNLDEAIFSGEDYDWIAQQTIFYQWVGDEITDIKSRLRGLQTEGALILILGFLLQLTGFFIPQ